MLRAVRNDAIRNNIKANIHKHNRIASVGKEKQV